MNRPPIQAVTFDVGGTLIEPWPSVGHVYARVAADHGVPGVSPDQLNQRFVSAWTARNGRVESKSDWAGLVESTMTGIGPFPDPQAFFETLYARFTEPSAWRVFEDVHPTLELLRAKGVRLGVCSNWDARLRPLLDRLDLTRFFEVIVISCEMGCRKPDPDIFRQAARGFDLPVTTLLHVGDSALDDVEGATRAGLQALSIRRHPPLPGDAWMSTLRNILARL